MLPQERSCLGLLSDDSEDNDYDPDCPDHEKKVKEESSSSDFTSASEDLSATLDQVEGSGSLAPGFISPFRISDGLGSKQGEKKLSLKDELTSQQESDSDQVSSRPANGKRHVERLDYKKLYDVSVPLW